MITDAYDDDTPIFFGKHKGTKLRNVPANYLLYLWDITTQGQTMYDQKLALYVKNNLASLKMEAIAEKQREKYSRQ